MKCKELQICDWIADNSGFPMRVNIVGDDYAYATFEGNEADPWEFDDKLEPPYPIKLTEEILEKNEFNLMEKIFISKAEGFEDAQERDTFELHISGYTIGVNGFIWYVHELQHALRLAGLREKADGFKV